MTNMRNMKCNVMLFFYPITLKIVLGHRNSFCINQQAKSYNLFEEEEEEEEEDICASS